MPRAGALGQAGDDQKFLVAADGAAARAHRVDHGHAAGGDIVAVADPAGVAPADLLAEVGAAAADELEQSHGLGVERLGRPAEAAMPADLDVVLGGDAATISSSRAKARTSSSGVEGRRLTRSTALSGTTLLGHAVDAAGLTLRPASRASASRSARSAAATRAFRPRGWLA